MPLFMFTSRSFVLAMAGALALAGVASAQTTITYVSGTPTFFIGKTTAQGFEGFRIVGAQPYSVFQTRIEGLLK